MSDQNINITKEDREIYCEDCYNFETEKCKICKDSEFGIMMNWESIVFDPINN